jgi:hypothetical protein
MAKKCFGAAAALVTTCMLTLATSSYDALAQGGNKNPGVHPPNAKFRGLSYSEWQARWWQEAFSIPISADNPFVSGQPFGGDDKVLFLAGLFGENTVEIRIPTGTALFFPVINSECSVIEGDPFHGDNEAELRECANGHMDGTSDRFAIIDGVPVKQLDRYRTESPLFEFGPLPADNILGAPEGATSEGVDAGFYLLLTPLSVGQHTIHFGGTFADGGSIDTTYIITVVPKGRF